MPLDGHLTVTVTDRTSVSDVMSSDDGQLRDKLSRGESEERFTLTPPEWRSGADGEASELVPTSAPALVPFGRAHTVRSLRTSGTTCWAYVFDVDPNSKSNIDE